MFGTVIMDSYTKDEVVELANAIDKICSPTDTEGWASAGIYCFWDIYTERVLYIGLAVDLAERFRQHNGIINMAEGCKKEQIEEYFSRNERLGYSIFTQSNFAQPTVHRNQHIYQDVDSVIEETSENSKTDIRVVEGILIEAFRKEYGHLPIWNKVGGSIAGQHRVTEHTINIVKSFCQPDDCHKNLLLAHSTIRELSNNPAWAFYENYLHAFRMNKLNNGMDFEESLEFYDKYHLLGPYYEMQENGYLYKRLSV